MKTDADIRIPAIAVSRGIAIGTAVCLYGKKRQFFRTELAPEQVDREIRRFRAAVRLASRQLGELGRRSIESSGNAHGILDFHRLLLTDDELLNTIAGKISGDRINAEWAVKLVTDSYIANYKAVADEKLRERHIDLEDVAERILTALGGGRRVNKLLDSGSIIVSREMNPSALIELSESGPAGMITEHGGWTSHTFILAREVGIPAVTGIAKVLTRIRTGDIVVVDGFRGEVILRPTEDTVHRYRDRHWPARTAHPRSPNAGDLKTLDGRQIFIRANADIAGGYEKAKAAGARGIGLYRSEFLFNQFRGVPGETEQYESYRRIADMTGSDGVRIRTFDFEDEFGDSGTGKCKNPALGLRAIRLSLSREKQFRVQLRALLQAAHGRKLDIILPMISDISEIRRTRQIISEERINLADKGISVGDPELGAMIEVPAAVLSIEQISEEVDFLCLGTNDLVQYTLAVDRDNESVAKWFNTLHPAVIKALSIVIRAAEAKRLPCIVCGEMAGSPFYVPVLIGLGATELSMNAGSVEKVRRLVAGIAYEEAAQLTANLEKCRTAADAENVVYDVVRTKWSHLFETEQEFYRGRRDI